MQIIRAVKFSNSEAIFNLNSFRQRRRAGAFFGSLASIPISRTLAMVLERYGRRSALMVFGFIFLLGATLTTISDGRSSGLKEIYAGRVISCFGIGAVSAIGPSYVSECAPKEVRGMVNSLVQISVSLGTMIAYFVNLRVGVRIPSGASLWRIPFAIQGYKVFLVYGTINIVAMIPFALWIPETKGKSLEEMDVVFGAVSAHGRQAHIEERQKALEIYKPTEVGPVN